MGENVFVDKRTLVRNKEPQDEKIYPTFRYTLEVYNTRNKRLSDF